MGELGEAVAVCGGRRPLRMLSSSPGAALAVLPSAVGGDHGGAVAPHPSIVVESGRNGAMGLGTHGTPEARRRRSSELSGGSPGSFPLKHHVKTQVFTLLNRDQPHNIVHKISKEM